MEKIDKIQNILREFFDDDSIVISGDTQAKDVAGWDSLANIQILLSIEDEFGLQFSLEELASFKCISDIVKTIK